MPRTAVTIVRYVNENFFEINNYMDSLKINFKMNRNQNGSYLNQLISQAIFTLTHKKQTFSINNKVFDSITLDE